MSLEEETVVVQNSSEMFGFAVQAAMEETITERWSAGEDGAQMERQARIDAARGKAHTEAAEAQRQRPEAGDAREREGTEADTGRRNDLMEPWPHPMPMEWWIRKSTELFHRYDLDESGSINADTEELSQLTLNISWQLQQNFGVGQPSPSEIEALTANLGRFDHSRKALSLEQFQQWYLSEVL